MADEFQGVTCSGSWWSSSMRCSDSIDVPLASCSTSVAGDPGGQIFCWSPVAGEVAADGNMGCFGNSPASCITFQDSQTLQLSDQMGSRLSMDTSSKISASGFSSPSVNHWSQSFLAESPEMYPLKDIGHEFFTDPSSSETAMNNVHQLYSFGSPLLAAESRPPCPIQFPEMLKAIQPRNFFSNNSTFEVNGNSAYRSFQDMQFMKSREIESNSEQVSDSSYKSVLKKTRIETPSPFPSFKVRKEKLGDRITALQQLVSPFGKTDTASVLYEAIEYIKFLHEEIRTLSSPYFTNGNQINNQQNMERAKEGKGRKTGLRSRGLCLVPISSTFSVACSEVPAIDFWASPPFDLNYI